MPGTSQAQSFTYSYKPQTDLVASVTPTFGAPTSYEYESDTGRLHSVPTTGSGGAILYQVTYTYNDLDQPTDAHVQQAPAGGGSLIKYHWHYEYYTSGELHTAKAYAGIVPGATGTPLSGKDFTYSYDGRGNRTDHSNGWVPNDLNQYTKNPLTGSDSILYDNRGNLTQASGLGQIADGSGGLTLSPRSTYEWNDRDQLASVQPTTLVNGSIHVSFKYDGQGRRISKDVAAYNATNHTWGTATSYRFVYDGWNLLAEYKATESGYIKVRSYVWGKDLSGSIGGAGGIGGLLSLTTYTSTGTPDKTYTPTYDGNGNITGLIDTATGTVAATFTYDPFGQILSATGPAKDACPFGFSSKYRDAETGLAYYGYRYYSPTIQRWISRDPSGESGGANLYGAMTNDPVNRVDPNGLEQIKVTYWNEFEAEVHKNPWVLVTSLKYNLPWFCIRGICYDMWAVNGKGISRAYSEARTQMEDEAAKPTTGSGTRAILNTTYYATYPMELTSAWANRYSQAYVIFGGLSTGAQGLAPAANWAGEITGAGKYAPYLTAAGQRGLLIVGAAATGRQAGIIVNKSIYGDPEEPLCADDFVLLALGGYETGVGVTSIGKWPVSGRGVTSETRGAVTNLGTRTAAENSELFAKLKPGEGMSGVFDHSTGKFVLRPSEDVPIGPLREGWVRQRGGHADVRADFGQALGADLSQAAKGRLSGFSLSKQPDGTVRFGWNSGQINVLSHGNRSVPAALRPAIENAVKNAFGS